jgi:hypothetical protein
VLKCVWRRTRCALALNPDETRFLTSQYRYRYSPHIFNSSMELHTFGRNVSSQPLPPIHDCAIRAHTIHILWASWCDAVIAHQENAGVWTVEYRGMGLTDAQMEHVGSSEGIKRVVSDLTWKIDFFGTAMHDGLRGYVSHGPEYGGNEVVLFGTDTEIENGIPDIQSFSLDGDTKVVAIRLTSNESVLVSSTSPLTSGLQIIHHKDLAELRRRLATDGFDPATSAIASFDHPRLCTNSTTATILDKNGQIHTSTSDPRYSKCLGRAYGGTADFEPISYLSETRVDRIASGGYMTAAVSSDGELFLWGQACPGAKGELSVLRCNDAPSDSQAVPKGAGVSAEDEQDEFVKCLTVRIDGHEAQVYDLAVGHGHLLVAAEMKAVDGFVHRAVLAAGDNSTGQLGCSTKTSYYSEFEEVSKLRNKKVLQLVAAGWTSYVVTSEA